jgi:hypothetical protein
MPAQNKRVYTSYGQVTEDQLKLIKMKKLSPSECIEICKLINPNLMWEWNDHFNMDDPPFYALNGTGNSGELYMLRFYYNNDKITLIDGNSENIDEKNINFQSNNEIIKILGVELDENKSSSSDESNNLIFKKYVEKIKDKFSTTVEYRMKESAIIENNEGLPYSYKIDLNVRVFVENNDFINSKIILAMTYYAPEPGTGTILHESLADVMIDNKDVFKFDNEHAYSGLDSYYKLEIYNKILGQKSSRTEQIQFNIDLATLLKIVNAKTFEIRFNKKWNYGGRLLKSEIIKFIGLYNALFDSEYKRTELIDHINKKEINWKEVNDKIIALCNEGKKDEAVKLCQSQGEDIDYDSALKHVEDMTDVIVSDNTMQKKSNSNCFVITATMGNPYHPIVDEFRAYRDSKLLTNFMGKVFVRFYYKVGPFAAFVISKSLILRKLSFRLFVNPVYKRIKND